jgi:hypothetical protein
MHLLFTEVVQKASQPFPCTQNNVNMTVFLYQISQKYVLNASEVDNHFLHCNYGNLFLTSSIGCILNCFVLVDNTRLKATDYGCLCEKLHRCAAKWKQIAQSLRFTYSEINNIKTCPLNMDLDSCIDDVIGVWLQWAPGDARGSEDYATLEQLQNAVSKAGFGVVASELKGMSIYHGEYLQC